MSEKGKIRLDVTMFDCGEDRAFDKCRSITIGEFGGVMIRICVEDVHLTAEEIQILAAASMKQRLKMYEEEEIQ